jgi:preprotein translocase subunit YajC
MIVIQIASALMALFACYLYYIILIKPNQDEKNNRKKEMERRAKIDKIFTDNPITAAYRNN